VPNKIPGYITVCNCACFLDARLSCIPEMIFFYCALQWVLTTDTTLLCDSCWCELPLMNSVPHEIKWDLITAHLSTS
jgi:hypothetical protein